MKLLWIDATMRPPKISRTHRLAQAYVQTVCREEGAHLTHLSLAELPDLQPLNRETLALRESTDLSDPMFDRARAFAAADRIVVSAPYWDLSFPALLKAYIEQISVANITFSYHPGSEGRLCRADKLVYITTSGGPMEGQDGGTDYWRSLCAGLFRIPQVEAVSAQGLDMYPDQAEEILSQAIHRAETMAKTK